MNTVKGGNAALDNVMDSEKGFGDNVQQTTSSSDVVDGQIYTDYEDRPDFWTRMGLSPNSFKRRHGADKHNQLNKTMKARHLNMIAIGGSIGAGLFVGSGSALRTGGPGALLIGFGIMGIVCIPSNSSTSFS